MVVKMNKTIKIRNTKTLIFAVIIIIIVTLISYFQTDIEKLYNKLTKNEPEISYTVENIPEYTGKPYVTINDNKPNFTEEDYKKESFEQYNDLDEYNRCTGAYANVSKETMPTEKRGSIGMIKPTGWHTIKYDNVDGKYLYNRCHLIGYQLTGENANEKNLITCTRYMNAQTMLEFENQVADYIKETNNHVLYRVIPLFENDNMLATGVQIEASSVEDKGEGLSFNVFIYNVQEGIEIDYKTGESKQI